VKEQIFTGHRFHLPNQGMVATTSIEPVANLTGLVGPAID
jgi:hypothetical protein